jgi:hypothetical protein
VDILVFGRPKLERWDARPFHDVSSRPRDHHDAYERDVAPESPGEPGERARAIAAAIRRYDIFPPELVQGVVRRPVEVGDTVGVCYRALPVIRLFFAARVVDVLDREEAGWWRGGFTYRTLRGHPELGEETFCVEKELATGRVRVALRSWSRPGTLLSRMFSPLVRRLQVRATERALAHLTSTPPGA